MTSTSLWAFLKVPHATWEVLEGHAPAQAVRPTILVRQTRRDLTLYCYLSPLPLPVLSLILITCPTASHRCNLAHLPAACRRIDASHRIEHILPFPPRASPWTPCKEPSPTKPATNAACLTAEEAQAT